MLQFFHLTHIAPGLVDSVTLPSKSDQETSSSQYLLKMQIDKLGFLIYKSACSLQSNKMRKASPETMGYQLAFHIVIARDTDQVN